MPAKRIFSIALALLLGVSFATPSGARAAEFFEGGLRYESEVISTGAGTVTVAQVMGCQENVPCPDDLVIPDTAGGYPVTKIANYAFRQSSVKTAVIGNSVTHIGIESFEGPAFANKSPLTSLTLGTSVQSIGAGAFRYTSLTSVSISNSVTSIAEYAFAGSLLTSVTWGSSLTTIGESAFSNNQFTSVTFSSPLTTIGPMAFFGNLLTAVTFSNSVTSIGDSAFRNNHITSVTIPNSITTIENSAFYQNLLTSVTIPNTVTHIGAYSFSLNKLTDVTIPDSVTSIGIRAFQGNLLATLTLGNSVTSIPEGAFADNLLTTLAIPNWVTSIGDGAFFRNTLASLEIGSGVTSIGNDGFGRNRLTAVTFRGNAPTAGVRMFDWNEGLQRVKRFDSTTGWGSTWGDRPVVITVKDTVKPYFTGTVAVGNTITANPGTWDGPATPTVAYQWYACTAAITLETQAVPATCSAISSATQGTFVITAAESGKFIAVGVTASSVGATPATWLSITIAKAPAVNTVAPVVTGTASVYSTLTASTGTWTGFPAPTLSYQWLRCSAAGAAANTLPTGCTTISGATQATYATDAADDQQYLRVRVTATNDLGSATTYSATTAKIAAFNTVAPVVTGTASAYSTLTASSGTWAGDPAPTYTYQWLRCTAAGAAANTLPAGCTTISGATQATYVIAAADYQKYLRVQVTATNDLGSASKYTAASAKIAGRITVNTVAPIITGTTAVNATLTGAKGTWTGAPVPTHTYQWLRCTRAGSASDALPSGCTTISGATRTTYKLTTTDYGKYLRLKVVGTNSLGSDTKYSAATAKIAGIDPVNTVAPRITGTASVGSTVTGTEGTWTGFPDPTSTYQWFRCTSAGSASTAQPSGCTAISGATRSTYKLVTADKTAGYLRVRVTGTSAEGRAVRFSAAVKVQ